MGIRSGSIQGQGTTTHDMDWGPWEIRGVDSALPAGALPNKEKKAPGKGALLIMKGGGRGVDGTIHTHYRRRTLADDFSDAVCCLLVSSDGVEDRTGKRTATVLH